MSEYRRVPINRQRREIYGDFRNESPDQSADDIRRELIIDYSILPEMRVPGYEKKDTWREEAIDVMRLTGGGPEITVLDAGMSGGYQISQLLDLGFQGCIVGLDIEAPHLREMQQKFDKNYPNARLELGIGDAEKLTRIKIGKTSHRIKDSFFDVVFENYIGHHTHDPYAAINAAMRVTKPGGYNFFAARKTGHLASVYDCAEKAATSLGLNPPKPYYDNFDFDDLRDYLTLQEKHGKCRIIKEGRHVDYLWIDGDEQGRRKFSNAVMALLPDMNRGKVKITPEELKDFIDNLLFPGYIDGAIRYYNGYILDYAAQKYYAIEVIK